MIFDCVFFTSQRSRGRYLPGQPAQVPLPSAPGRFSCRPPLLAAPLRARVEPLLPLPEGSTAGPGSRGSSRCSSRCPAAAGTLRSWHRSRAPVGGAGGRSGTRLCRRLPSGWRGRSSSRTRRVHNNWETGVLVLFIPCTFHRHENWKRWNLWGKSNFPFLLNGFSLILTWFYHVPVEGLRVYTVC